MIRWADYCRSLWNAHAQLCAWHIEAGRPGNLACAQYHAEHATMWEWRYSKLLWPENPEAINVQEKEAN